MRWTYRRGFLQKYEFLDLSLSLLVLVTDFFAPQLAMESVGDLTVMVLLVVQDFCKLTEPREFLKLLSVPFLTKTYIIF